MSEYLKKVLGQVLDFIKELSPVKKVAAVLTAAGVFTGMTLLFMWAGNTQYTPLMVNLNAEDSANIIRVLREKHIPFRVDPTGKNVSVPNESLYDFRLELATMGLPQSGTVGYEIFDKQSLNSTALVQKINQKRALEGELMRTINTIRGVRRSRVHLATPQKSTFVEDQKKSTASVVVDLDPGIELTEKQVYGIGNLVARGVEGMEIADVVIMDSNGKVLSKNSSDPLSAQTANQLDYQEKIEHNLEKRIETMLSRVVGDGHVVARVTADIDFSQIAETQTILDSEGLAPVSTEKRNDVANMLRPGPVGAAGAVSNTPGQAGPAASETKNDTNKNYELTNFEIPKTVRKTTRPTGMIKKISVAVMVDGKQIKSTGKDGVVQTKVEPWSPEKLKEFEEVISSALALDKKRGDSLEIKNEEFTREDFEEGARILAEREHKAYVQNLIVYAVMALSIILFFLFVVRPFIKWVTENTIDSVDTFLPQTIEELERLQKNTNLPDLEEVVPVLPEKMDPEKVEGEMMKEKIVTLVDANPHKAALILKDWIYAKPKEKDEPAGKGKLA